MTHEQKADELEKLTAVIFADLQSENLGDENITKETLLKALDRLGDQTRRLEKIVGPNLLPTTRGKQ